MRFGGFVFLPTPQLSARSLSLSLALFIFIFYFCFSIRVCACACVHFAIVSYVRSIQSIDFNTSILSTCKCWIAIIICFVSMIIGPSNKLQSKYSSFDFLILNNYFWKWLSFGIRYIQTAIEMEFLHCCNNFTLTQLTYRLVGWLVVRMILFGLRYSHADPDTWYNFWVHHFRTMYARGAMIYEETHTHRALNMRVSTNLDFVEISFLFSSSLLFIVYTCHS